VFSLDQLVSPCLCFLGCVGFANRHISIKITYWILTATNRKLRPRASFSLRSCFCFLPRCCCLIVCKFRKCAINYRKLVFSVKLFAVFCRCQATGKIVWLSVSPSQMVPVQECKGHLRKCYLFELIYMFPRWLPPTALIQIVPDISWSLRPTMQT